MSEQKLIPHLFRTEYSKIVAVLCKTFGLSNIQLAEDIVSETFLVATESWGLKGIPDQPTSWLYKVAKNRTLDFFKREKTFNEKIKPNLQIHLLEDELEINLSDKIIADSQLQMLFAVCNPIISTEAQIAMALKVLCGFGVNEIAQAFLSNKETINKRLHRAKEKFRKNKTDLTFPPSNILNDRLDNVLSIIYLLFNEGYYSTVSENTIRKEFCVEAMRLTYTLLNYGPSNLPKTNALMALLCFHSSRFEARTNSNGELILYDNQDRNKWNDDLIKRGKYYLSKSAKGEVTKYHLEAGISFWHCKKEDSQEKWENILQYYNQLLQIEYSPITALNRTYALSKANGKVEAIKEALKINLKENHLFHTLLAELYQGIDERKKLEHLEKALQLVKTENEKRIIEQKMKEPN